MRKPALQCSNCLSEFAAAGTVPMCQTQKGCPIKAIAQDATITRTCRIYMRARNLLEYPHLQEMGHELLKKEGIRDSSLLILLEGVVQEYRNEKREQQKRINEAKNLAAKGRN